MKMINRIIVIAFIFVSCIKQNQVEQAKDKADKLLLKIETGSAIEDFPEKYFPCLEGQAILYDLQHKCDFVNRKGGFINDFKMQEGTKK